MNWYAIRTAPGAQMPQREYWAEPSVSAIAGRPRGKGYRIRSSVNPTKSAVELALDAAGVVHYMPAEYSAVRNRQKKGVYEVRRFAMLKGYAFVSEIETDEDWARVLYAAGVQGAVCNAGEPFPISSMDIHRLRMYEANSRMEAEAKAKRLSTNEARDMRKEKKKAARSARRKLFPGKSVRLIWGDKIGREATVAGWKDDEHVRVLLGQLEAADAPIVVPYEFLKAAE